MLLTSNIFILFIGICLLVYYLVPKRFRWMILLLSSYVYYIYSGGMAVVFLILATLITYICAVKIELVSKKSTSSKVTTKRIVAAGIIFNLLMLAVLKYTNFFVENFNHIVKGQLSIVNLILPLGISYYTFQAIGYLLDVYWGRIEAEKNLFRFALFVSFFPQLLQGPIGRYGRLANQLYAGHNFKVYNIKYGLERILWGIFKKMVWADWAAVYADAIFKNPDQYSGIAIFGVLLYSIELYGNFSGGIDIVIGVANLFGISMDENFKRPFFAISITDFWHRWHITLGTWMKDYVFYPLTLSKIMKKCQKFSKKIWGRKIGRNIPICISNLVVFFIVGVWHGPTWSNIGWGVYNGVIIAFSGLFADVYKSIKQKLHIKDNAKFWTVFMILRTFILVNISWYFECVDTFGTAMKMMKYSVTQFQPSQFLLISSGKLGVAFTPYALGIIVVGCCIVFFIGVLQEKGMKIRESLSRVPWGIQFAVIMILLVIIPLCSPALAAGGFIYAQF